MPGFQKEIDDAKKLASSRGFGRLTFGWKEREVGHQLEAASGSVTVTSAAPSASRIYQRGRATPWLAKFENDLTIGVFGTGRL